MAQLIDDIQLVWRSLQESTDVYGWRSIPVSAVGLCMLRAGRNFPEKCEALIAGFDSSVIPASEKLPVAQGFSVVRVEANRDGLVWLALTRNPHGSLELFTAMVTDVVYAMTDELGADAHQLLRIFLGRIRAWQIFMRKGAEGLGPEEEIGLIGELELLNALLEAGMPQALAVGSWVGPLDHPVIHKSYDRGFELSGA